MTDLASLVVNRRRTQNDRLRYRFTYFPPNISLFPSFTHDPFRKTHRTGTEKDLQTAPFCSTPFSFFSVVLMRAWAWNMEANATPHDHEDQDEYVLLDLDGVSGLVDVPPNAKYVLSGLDTLNPVLIIDDKFKLIGEYEETIGTCIAFTEQDSPVVHEETGPSEVNLFSGTRLVDSSQPPTKQVRPVCQLQKVLKFKISPDSEIQSPTAEEAN